MKMLAATLFVLVLAAATIADPPASQPAALSEKRRVLAEHQTVAKLTGIAYQRCRGMTAQCPDECGNSGDFATFSVVSYLAYRKPGQYGEAKTTTYTFQLEDNHKNLKVAKELAAEVRGLKPDDYVLLSWRHDYVTKFFEGGGSGSGPERPLAKLQKISKDEADRLIGQAAHRPTSQPAANQAAANAFQIQCKKAQDRVVVTTEGDSTVFVVTSPSGIGEATIQRKTDAWPKNVVVQLNLRELESLEISSKSMEMSASSKNMDSKVQIVDDETGHYYRLAIPGKFLDDKAPTLTIKWIDFLR
jgi:hypothetical protein